MSSQRQLLLFFSCQPSDRFALFISELQAQAGIVNPIDGFFFLFFLACFTASFQTQTVFVDPIDGLLCSFLFVLNVARSSSADPTCGSTSLTSIDRHRFRRHAADPFTGSLSKPRRGSFDLLHDQCPRASSNVDNDTTTRCYRSFRLQHSADLPFFGTVPILSRQTLHGCRMISSKCWMIETPACLMKQFSLLEIMSTAVLLAIVVVVVVDLLKSSMLLTQLHFKMLTGAHLLLMEC